MIAFSIVHDYGFGMTCDAKKALGIIQCRHGIEVRSFDNLASAYRFGAYGFANRYVARSSETDIRVIMPTFEVLAERCLFDAPGMPPFGVITERWFALLTGQGRIGNTVSLENLLWFLTKVASHEPVWIRECVSEAATWDWERNKIVPVLMVESAYHPYAGAIPKPRPESLVQAVQPGYLPGRMGSLTSPEGFLPSGSFYE